LAKYWDFKYTFLLLIFITWYVVIEVGASNWQENCVFKWHCFFFLTSIFCYLRNTVLQCAFCHLYMKYHISFTYASWIIMVKEIVTWSFHIEVLLFLLLESVNIMLKIKLCVYIDNVIVIEYRKLKRY
jgi:hypothetical protein